MIELAREAAMEAGKLLLDSMGALTADDVRYKGHIDLVTRLDKESEQLIISKIRARYPDHGIVAEESDRLETSSEFTWVIDPLDGTTNYVHSFPLFCVSIGVCRAGVPIAGVVYAPYMNELFEAEVGRGATLNGRRLKVSRTESVAEAFFCTGFASLRSPTQPDNIGNFIRLLRSCQGVWRGGSAALELAYVGAGRLDGFWELNLSAWDVAAGGLIVTEAGGRITDLKGGAGWLEGRTVLASNGVLHDALLARLDALERLPEGFA